MFLDIRVLDNLYVHDGTKTYTNPRKIAGVVTEKKLPIPCRVRLFEKLSGRLIAETVTDAQGNYEFDYLTAVKFFLVAHHPASTFNAVIQDNVVPK